MSAQAGVNSFRNGTDNTDTGAGSDASTNSVPVFKVPENTMDGLGYHPKTNRLQIIKMEGDETAPQLSSDKVVCHYFPTKFTETYKTEYQKQQVRGVAVQRLQFIFGQPRVWTMTLLFNDLGEPASRQGVSGRKSVDASLASLADWTRPPIGGGRSEAAATQRDLVRPPIVLVAMLKDSFLCYITGLSINRTHLHPITSATLRATVDLEFSEFLPSKI